MQQRGQLHLHIFSLENINICSITRKTKNIKKSKNQKNVNLVSQYLICVIKNSQCIFATIYFKKICFLTVISITIEKKIWSLLKSSHKLSQKTHSFSGINNCTDEDTKIKIRFIKKIRFVNLPLYFIGETGNLIINYLVYLLSIYFFKNLYSV